MNTEEFNFIINNQVKMCTDMLVRKAEEYAEDTDRLHNFNVAAELQGISKRQALAGMMAKHTISVYDMCYSDELYSVELWNEKITDHINYLLLLKAVVLDEDSEANESETIDDVIDSTLERLSSALEKYNDVSEV